MATGALLVVTHRLEGAPGPPGARLEVPQALGAPESPAAGCAPRLPHWLVALGARRDSNVAQDGRQATYLGLLHALWLGREAAFSSSYRVYPLSWAARVQPREETWV